MSGSEHVLLLADVHANRSALRVAVADARQRYGGLPVWFLGDLFGRGPDPVATCHWFLESRPKVAVVGNHDWGLIGRSRDIQVSDHLAGLFRKSEWQALLQQRKELAQVGLLDLDELGEPRGGPALAYVEHLPILCSPHPGVYLVHGGREISLGPQPDMASVIDRLVWDYAKSQGTAQHTLEAIQWIVAHSKEVPEGVFAGESWGRPCVVLTGHWHCRVLYLPNGQGWVNPVEVDRIYELDPSPERPVLISPGGVGFPSEAGDRDASYAVLRLEDHVVRAVTFHKAPFARKKVRGRMACKGYPDEVIRRLRMPGEN